MHAGPISRIGAHGATTVAVLCFLAVLFDGFDTAVLASVLPALAEAWQVRPAAFTGPVVATNGGAVIGYVMAGWLSARFGARRLLICGVAVFGSGSLLSALVLATHSMSLLTVVRLATGIGLGVVLPTAVSFAAAHFSAERRQRVSATVTLGLASGTAVVGLFGGGMLRSIGSAGIFVVGGVLPLLLAVVLAVLLPATAPADGATHSTAAHEAGVGRILQPRLRVVTLTLWVFAFLVFLVAYTLTSWVPTLLTEYGFAATDAPIGLAFLSIGGVLGGLVLIALTGRVGAAAALVVMSTVAVVGLVVSGAAGLGGLGLLFAIGVAGAGVAATQVGQLSLAVTVYPDGGRTTGVGWAAASGRIGSIVGPAAAGVLLAMAVPASQIILLQVVPVVVAAACAGVLWRRTRSGSGQAATPAVDSSR